MEKKRKERDLELCRTRVLQALIWGAVIMTQVFLLHCMEVRAEQDGAGRKEAERKAQSALEITSQLYASRGACEIPPETYTDEDGARYERKSWETVSVTIPAQKQIIEEERSFKQVEGMAKIPESLEFEIQNPEDGRTGTAVCRQESVKVVREWWSSDFSFPVQFHSYDADYYQIGVHMIPFDEERPQLDGCRNVLLEMIGAPSDSYRITDICWSGEEYRDEAGILCRDATAFGEKLLRDYQANYRGMAEFPAAERWQTVTVYTPFEEETTQETDLRIIGTEPAKEVQNPAGEEDDLEEKLRLPFWKRLVKVVKVIVSLLIPAAILFLFLLVKRRRSWYTGQKEKKQQKEK